MDYREALNKAFATFVAGATAAPVTAAIADISFFKAAGIAGIVAVWNWLGRAAQTWVNS